MYLDDLVIFNYGIEQHLLRLDLVLTRLRGFNIKLSADKKKHFMKKKVKFLGHIFSELGVETDQGIG